MRAEHVKIGEDYALRKSGFMLSPARVRVLERVTIEVGGYHKRQVKAWRCAILDKEGNPKTTYKVYYPNLLSEVGEPLEQAIEGRYLGMTWDNWLEVKAERDAEERRRKEIDDEAAEAAYKLMKAARKIVGECWVDSYVHLDSPTCRMTLTAAQAEVLAIKLEIMVD